MLFSSGSRMKDFVSCYSDHAVRVSDSSCSGSVRAQLRSSTRNTAALQGSIGCLYRTKLTSYPFKEFLIRITWSKSLIGLGLSTAVDEEVGTSSNCSSPMLILRKRKGVQPYTSSGGSTVVLYWDISAPKYGSGPEPLQGFYLVVVVDSEFGLLLGDTTAIQDQINHQIGLAGSDIPTAQSHLLSRREQALGSSLFSTRVRFGKNGKDHDIAIQCKEDSELSVCIDKKKVVHVKRLRWNFRGNQTIFVDGMPVDMMWDVHDWWFGGSRNDVKVSGGGHAVFMFRTRSGLESRLWLEELLQAKFPSGTGDYGFSLVIDAYKSSSSQA